MPVDAEDDAEDDGWMRGSAAVSLTTRQNRVPTMKMLWCGKAEMPMLDDEEDFAKRLLEQDIKRSVPACTKQEDDTAYPSAAPVYQLGCAQLIDLSHNLSTPDLAQGMGTAVGKIVVLSVVVNPIKQRQSIQFVVQACQRLSPPPHIGLSN